jgi:hypothetical protein
MGDERASKYTKCEGFYIIDGWGNHELVFGAEDELGSLEGNHSSHFSFAATLKRVMIDSASSIAGLTSKENTGTPGVSSGAS